MSDDSITTPGELAEILSELERLGEVVKEFDDVGEVVRFQLSRGALRSAG